MAAIAMSGRMIGPWSCLVLVLLVGRQADGSQTWHGVRHPAVGKPRVIGSYTAGCLQGAVALPPEGEGFIVLRRSRNRFFGHPRLIEYVQTLGRLAIRRNLGVLLIGDLSQPRGGPMAYGHRSHQVGLDVDIWFGVVASTTSLSFREREALYPPSLLTADRQSLDPDQWSPSHAQLLQMAAEFPDVARIFVNPVIKRALCDAHAGAPWLRKIRPWWGHHAHFHVRLQCPAGQAACVDQPSPPPGDGCNTTLDWWFSAAARRPVAPKRPVPIKQNKPLPAACTALLNK